MNRCRQFSDQTISFSPAGNALISLPDTIAADRPIFRFARRFLLPVRQICVFLALSGKY